MSTYIEYIQNCSYVRRTYLFTYVGTLSPSRFCFSRVYSEQHKRVGGIRSEIKSTSKHCTYNRYITQTTHTQTYRTVAYTLTQTRSIVNILKEFLFCMCISKCFPFSYCLTYLHLPHKVQQPVPLWEYLANTIYLSLSLQPSLMDSEFSRNLKRLSCKHGPGGRGSGD